MKYILIKKKNSVCQVVMITIMEYIKRKKKLVIKLKLPKLSITKFDELFESWLPFWNKFEAEIDSTLSPAVAKFAHLKELSLRGRRKKGRGREEGEREKGREKGPLPLSPIPLPFFPSSLSPTPYPFRRLLRRLKELVESKVTADIDALPLNSEGYDRAKNILKGEYGKTGEIINAYVHNILEFPIVTNPDPKRVNAFYKTSLHKVQWLETPTGQIGASEWNVNEGPQKY